MTARALVLDANILVRAVLGSRVPELLAAHAAQATFLAPDIAFDEAREHLPTILAKRGKSAEAIQAALDKLETLARVIVLVPAESYLPFKDRALARIGPRDREDWPVLVVPSRPIARSGPRTRTSSALASQRGPQPASNCFLPSRIEASGRVMVISKGRRTRRLWPVSRCARGP